MDKRFKLNINNKRLSEVIKLTIIALLLTLEIIICAQYVTLFIANGGIMKLVFVLVCCVLLAVFETVDSFVINNFAAKMVFYGLDSIILLFLCLLTGNSYLSALYCIVLTQFYISVDDFKKNVILFCVSCGLFVVSFIGGWFMVNQNVSAYQSMVEIAGGIFFGIFIIAIHCLVTNFLLKFSSNNVQLRYALKVADESRAQLQEVYEQLSETAVFEERNRIAKDIHDNAGHSMTTVIMQTEAAKLLIDNNPEEAKNRIISANIQAKNALEQMRESVHLLAGRAQTKTLREEIEEIIAQTIDGTELKIRCDLQDVSVGAEEYRFILNSVKECIANGVRHGKATAFYIEMKNNLSEVGLLISDNGEGTDGKIEEGFGLKSIREKVEALGGNCSFSSEAGEGFEVVINLPMNNKKQECSDD